MPPGKHVTRQPVGSVPREISSTFGSVKSAPPHGALLASRYGAAWSGGEMGRNYEFGDIYAMTLLSSFVTLIKAAIQLFV
eukprot:1031493-Prymnesium_polylepis.1